MKKLSELLSAGIGVKTSEVKGTVDKLVSNISFDSRKAIQDSLFVAIRGTQADGHRFIGTAIESGSNTIVCEELPADIKDGVTYVLVPDSAYALSILACNYYDNPSQKIKLIGITGTNGKTTTATLLHELFRSLGYHCGLISTVRNAIDEKTFPATHTTPDPVALNSLMSEMFTAGCTHCFMEVSSHAIAQKRIAGLQYAGGVFTNITPEHMDYHKTMEEYIKVKKSFFDLLPQSAFALVNTDDKNGTVMLQNTRAAKYTYGLRNIADYKSRIIESHFSGLMLELEGQHVHVRLAGSYNASNLTAVYATALLLGESAINVLENISNLCPVEGRFDYLVSKNNITAIVDYAHTPDALQKVLESIHDISKDAGIITVVGCGGNRDVSKRPKMARIAGELSEKVILTSDNPRFESPEDIIEQMLEGVEPTLAKKTLSIVNRKEAIKTAVTLAKPGDVVLVAGKGHEKYQEVKGVRTPFDDKKVLMEIMNQE